MQKKEIRDQKQVINWTKNHLKNLRKKSKNINRNYINSYRCNKNYYNNIKDLYNYRDRLMTAKMENDKIIDINLNNLDKYYFNLNISINNLCYLEILLEKLKNEYFNV